MSRFFFVFSLPSADTEAVGRSFIPFVYYYYSLHCVNGERILLTGKSFFFLHRRPPYVKGDYAQVVQNETDDRV